MDWVRRKYVFDYYTSTTTTKRQIPMWLRWVGIGVLVLLVLLFAIRWYFASTIAEYEKPATTADVILKGGAPVSATSAAGAGAMVNQETPTDYAKAHLPRFPTMPWKAPVFDQRATTADPQLYCMSSQAGSDGQGQHTEGSCTCVTEQGTSYDISQPECRTTARYGGVYNPYKVEREFQHDSSAAPVYAPVVQTPASSSSGAVIQNSKRPMATFPESLQNRFGGS